MKGASRIAVVLMTSCVLLCAAPEATAQDRAQIAQAASPSAAAASAQHGYDPLAGRPHLRGGIWEHALGAINPHNKDYGASVARVRSAVISATIENGVFWLAMVMSVFVLLSLRFIYWLVQERARRLDISVTILSQIANAFLDAQVHALDAIERHNRLADDYNAMAEKTAAIEQQKAENLKRARGVSADVSSEDVSSGGNESNASVEARAEVPSEISLAVAESDKQVRQRYASQISALQEKNKALRNSLNEALTQLDGLKRHQSPGAGV